MGGGVSVLRQERLRIGFLTARDPSDRKAWSGIIHHLAESLAQHAGEVIYLGPASTGRGGSLQKWDRRCRNYFAKDYNISHSLYLSAGYAKVFQERLEKNPVDVIFAPVASTEIALLKTSIPIVYMSDATFAAVNDYYDYFSNLLFLSKLESNLIEYLAIKKSSRLIYPSTWAADSAIQHYGAKAERIFTFPMGANIDTSPTDEQIAAKKRGQHLRLLFVGVEWDRKGGFVAFDTLEALEKLGVTATLTVVGCVPPDRFVHPRMTVIPFLDRNDADERRQLFDLYLNSDIFILPTRAECMGIVFCEAAAFGLPVFASSTGGVPSVVEHDKTGYLFPLDASGADYALAIARLWQQPAGMDEMVRASRERFKKQLNWDAWGREASKVLHAAAINPNKVRPQDASFRIY